MTKWIVLGVVVLLAIAGWFFRGSIIGLFGASTPAPIEEEIVDPLAGWGSYASSTMGVAIKYAPGYTLKDPYAYTGVSATKPIAGVAFVVPAATATGTNLSADSYISVEQLPRANKCTGDIFVADNVAAHEVLDGGLVYSHATTSGAAAGNRYEEHVYAVKDSKPCTAVRYYIHTTVLENYPEGTVRAYERNALLSEFDAIRRTLQLTGTASTVTP